MGIRIKRQIKTRKRRKRQIKKRIGNYRIRKKKKIVWRKIGRKIKRARKIIKIIWGIAKNTKIIRIR